VSGKGKEFIGLPQGFQFHISAFLLIMKSVQVTDGSIGKSYRREILVQMKAWKAQEYCMFSSFSNCTVAPKDPSITTDD